MFNTDNNSSNNNNNSNNRATSSHFSNAFLESPVTSKANFYSSLYNSTPSLRRRSANGTFQAFSQRIKTHPSVATSSKSGFTASSSNLPSTNQPSLVRSPQPLSIMGYRTDVFTTHQKSIFPATKSPKTLITSNSSSNHMVKPSTMKTCNYRWKTKPGSNTQVHNYPDPLYNADGEFIQRITEMAGLEVETIKLEKLKKTRRK